MIRSIRHISFFFLLVVVLVIGETARVFPAGFSLLVNLNPLAKELRSSTDRGTDSLSIVAVEASFHQIGKASYYGRRFHGRSTANGESFDMDGFTAAHRNLPFGSIVRVVNPDNNTAIIVQINDRGPFVRARVIDMARGAARCIDVSLQKVNLEAFRPTEFSSADSVLGFCGTNYTSVRIAPGAVTVTDSIENFSEAVRRHRIMAAKNPTEEVYLMIVPLKAESSSDSKFVYLIGTRRRANDYIDPTSLLTD